MTLKKTLSLVLTLALMLSVLAPCGMLQASAAQAALYGSEQLIQVTEPVIGESYYLGADVGGTMMYFRHGTVTDTVPYSLVVTDNIDHNWCYKLTLEDSTETSEKFEGGFQFTYTNPSNDTLTRIYCMDVLKDATVSGQTGVMDTGLNNTTPYKNRHSFFVDDLDGVKVLRKYGNDNILVIKQVPQTVDGETTNAWRMLGVPQEDLANEGVYPVMLLAEHTHSFGSAVVDSAKKTATRTCVGCGYEEVVYGSKLIKAEEYTVGGNYYLAADVAGTMRYFSIASSVTATAPYSFPTTEDVSATKQVTLEDPDVAEESKGDGFQIAYDNNGVLTRIYCMDVLKDATMAGQTGIMDTGANNTTPYRGRHTFECVEIGGVKVLRKLANNNILVVKYFDSVSAWRMLGVPEAELSNEGVYPVILMEEHPHDAAGSTYQMTDAGHQQVCWCGGYAAEVAHTYGAITADSTNKTATRTCTICGYKQVVLNGTVEQIQYPTIGETYYLSANVGGVIKYFTTGTVTNTAPYSLVTTERISVAVPVTLEDSLKTSEKFSGGFQFTYDNNGTTTRIYCMDVLKDATTAGQTGVMDTGVNSTTPYKNRHSFWVDEVNGVKVLRKYGNDNILVVKLMDSTNTYRMLGVPEAELANSGVYPVTLSVAHEHSYAWTTNDNGTVSQLCAACGHEIVYYGGDTKVSQVEDPAIGGTYYLAANVDGVIKFFTTGTVTNTAPYSLVTTERSAVAVPVTLEDPSAAKESKGDGFQLAFDNNGTVTRIYCMDVLKDATTAGQTGIMDTGTNSSEPYRGRHTFELVEIGGVKVLRKLANNNILVVKLNETTNTYRMLGVTEAELANEGVYPVMLANLHEHTYGDTYYGDADGHWTLCDCGSKSATVDHVVESWTVVTHPTATEPGSKTGVCTVCGTTVTMETPVVVNSWNIVLGDNIGLNFVLALTDGDAVQVNVDGAEVPVTLTDNKDGTYTVFIEVAAAQMTSEIQIVVNGQAVEKTYSVRDYADVILAGEYNDYAKALVSNMLVYGGAAQNYFQVNTDDLADAGITAAEVTVPSDDLSVEILDELAGVDCYGVTLVLRSKTAVRFYFTAESVEGLTFAVNGNVYTPVSANGMYYVEVADINPQELADALSMVVSDGTSNLAVSYSPMTYISRMYHKTGSSEQLKAVVKALYGYHLAAKAYIANMNLDGTFVKQSETSKTLYEGVTQVSKTYIAAGYGEVDAHIIVVDAAANVELKVSAGAWDETNNADNPAEVKTVVKHFRDMKNAGSNVLGMINGGFFDLNTTGSMLPLGMQVVDGVVKQTPNAEDALWGNNWFGMTTDGKYVISDAAGYESTYAGNVQQAVGGGRLLIVDGVVQSINSDRAYRTAVGVNANGDLVMVAVEDATYSDVCQIFVDMNLDIITVLNLDGGGSTAMYVPGAYYPKALILGQDGLLPREVADAVAIVVAE